MANSARNGGDPLGIAGLLDVRADETRPCVSIYVPTERAGPETMQARIRLENQLRRAREFADELGFAGRDIDPLLTAAHERLDDFAFWQHQLDGLAIFAGPDGYREIRAPVPFGELAVVADRYHLRPLAALLRDPRFLLLSLSENRVRLFRGTRSSLDELSATDLPKSLAAALWADDPEASLQFHSHQAVGSQRAIFHGQGAADDAEDSRLVRFLQAIDQPLVDMAGSSPEPLVLATVDATAAAFRELTHYPDLVVPHIPGNPEHTPEQDLHAAALERLEQRRDARESEAVAALGEALGTQHGSADLWTVLRAAKEGRVRDLFVAPAEHRWGPSPDGANANSEVHDGYRAGDVDLLDLAFSETLAHGGQVHVGEADGATRESGLAAIFRW